MNGYFLWTDQDGIYQREDVGDQPLTIGSQPICGVVIDEEDIGPIHAAIERERRGYRLRRLSRVRPLAVNGAPVSEDGRLRHGDHVDFGAWSGQFVAGGPAPSHQLRIVITRGSDELAIEMPLSDTVTTIGRLDGQILIEDAGVSSRHLEIENYGPDLRFVRDLGSTNGTELNGEPLGSERVALEIGSILMMGRVMIEVLEGEPGPAEAESVEQRTVVFVPQNAHA